MLWSSVRVPKDTLAALSEYRDRLQRVVDQHPSRFEEWLTEGRVSLATALEYLLLQQVQHSERSRRARRKSSDASQVVRMATFDNEHTEGAVSAGSSAEGARIAVFAPSEDPED
jgi:hypothetical protein